MKDKPLESGLYVTATPIGNLGDITIRALEVMRGADLILCEDTRHAGKLCAAYDITTPRVPYHDHNAAAARPALLERLQAGERLCLISDAGTPLISDPGYKLVREAKELGIKVIPLPGANAAIAALSAGGLPTDQFTFAGFPPAKSEARKQFLRTLSVAPGTLLFYEAPSRLGPCLEDMAEVLGNREGVVARELTKTYEEFLRGELRELASMIRQSPVKGEIVVMVAPAQEQVASEEAVKTFIADALQNMSVRDAAQGAADVLGVPKKMAYALALDLKQEKQDRDE